MNVLHVKNDVLSISNAMGYHDENQNIVKYNPNCIIEFRS